MVSSLRSNILYFFLFSFVAFELVVAAFKPIYAVGILIYFILFVYFLDLDRIKKIAPYLLWLMILQDLISRNAGLINHSFGVLIGHTDELFVLCAFPSVILNKFKNSRSFGAFTYKRIKNSINPFADDKKNFDYVFIVLGIILFLGFLSSFLNDVPWRVSVSGAFLMVKGLLLFIIFKELHFTKKDVMVFLKTIKYIAFVILIFAVIDFIMPQTLRSFFNIGQGKIGERWGIHYVQSLFIHPAKYGWFMTLVGLLYLAEFIIKKEKKSGSLSFMFFVASLFSLRYKVIMSIFTCSFFSSFKLSKRRILQIYIPGLLVLVISLLVFHHFFFSVYDLFYKKVFGFDYMHDARKALYYVAFLIGLNKFPLGVGFGRYGDFESQQHYSPVYSQYGLDKVYGLNPAHPNFIMDTYWPYITGELGFVGFMVLLSLFGYFIFRIFIGMKKESSIFNKVFLFFSLLVILQSLIDSLSSPLYNSAPQFIFIFSIIGISFSLLKEKLNSEISKDKNQEENKPKILIVGSSLNDKGGIVTVIKNIVSHSKIKDNVNIDLVSSYIVGSVLKRIAIFVDGLIRFIIKLSMDRPQVVHIHVSYGGSFYRKSIFVILSKIMCVPSILHVHGGTFKDFYSQLNRFIKKYCHFIFNLTDSVVVLSEGWKSFFSDFVNPEKITVIYNGVMPSHNKKNISHDKIICLYLGRLSKKKGAFDLLKAIKNLKEKEKNNVRFIFAGDGELEKADRLINEYGLNEFVEILGWVNGKEKEELFLKSDILILPSYNEGLPMSILEAMDYGLSIISTPVGGIPEIVGHQNGFLVDPGDIEQLTQKVHLLINDENLRASFGESNSKKVKTIFNNNLLMEQLLSLYFDIIKKNEKKREAKLKVCLASSSGGHLAQLKNLFETVDNYNFFLITEKNNTTESLKELYKTYFLKQQERRNFTFLFSFIFNILASSIIVIREKPDVILTTGAGAVVPLCIIGKLTGSKVVFIESFAKVKSPTLTGRIVYRFADKFYIQWEDLKKYYPKSEYRGQIY